MLEKLKHMEESDKIGLLEAQKEHLKGRRGFMMKMLSNNIRALGGKVKEEFI